MKPEEPSQLAQTQYRKFTAAGEDYVFLFDVADDVLHSCNVLGVFVIIGLVPFFDLSCFLLIGVGQEL